MTKLPASTVPDHISLPRSKLQGGHAHPSDTPQHFLTLQSASKNLAKACHLKRPPFSLVMMTDQATLPNPKTIIKHLPTGTAVIFRDYFVSERDSLAKELCSLCKEKKIPFFVAGNIALARKIRADGLHLPAHLTPKRGYWDGYNGMISAACHNAQEVRQACRSGVDFILLSPLFSTISHVGEAALGRAGFLTLAAQSSVPVFALGGIGPQTLPELAKIKGATIAGFAAISAFAAQ